MYKLMHNIRLREGLAFALVAGALSIGTANLAFAEESCTYTCIKKVGATVDTESGEATLYDCEYQADGGITCKYEY